MNAAVTIDVTIPQIPLFVPAEARAVFNELTHEALQAAMQLIAGYISGAAPVDTGHLSQSFVGSTSGPTGGSEIVGQDVTSGLQGHVFSNLPYAGVMNDGRRPGFPVSRAGIEAITLWAQRKLGLDEKEAKSAAWAIATVITRRGITGTHYVDSAVASATPQVLALFDTLGDEIVRGLTASGRA